MSGASSVFPVRAAGREVIEFNGLFAPAGGAADMTTTYGSGIQGCTYNSATGKFKVTFATGFGPMGTLVGARVTIHRATNSDPAALNGYYVKSSFVEQTASANAYALIEFRDASALANPASTVSVEVTFRFSSAA